MGWSSTRFTTTGDQGVSTTDSPTFAGLTVPSINGGPLGGFRNKIINGDGRINQRSASSGISDDEYAHDRHYALTQSNDITVSTVDNPADGVSHMMRLTQANASAQRMGYAQIIEAEETYKLRGKTVTLGGKLRYSNAAAVRYAVLEWTGTADSPTSDVVNDWTSGTYTAGNFFNSTTLTVTQVGSTTPGAATITDWAMTATIGSSATNIIVLFWTEGTAAQNSTLDMRWCLVEGDATGEDDPFSPRHPVEELSLCHRYFYRYDAGTNGGTFLMMKQSTQAWRGVIPTPIPLRTAPSVTYSYGSNKARIYIYSGTNVNIDTVAYVFKLPVGVLIQCNTDADAGPSLAIFFGFVDVILDFDAEL